MRYLRYLLILGALIVPFSIAQAQIGVGVGVDPGYGYGYDPGYGYGYAPACAYGYYSYYPYSCAPYGYYGPSWFVGGIFIGAGPWYRGYYGRGFGYGGYGFRGGYGYRGGVGYGRGGVGYARGGAVAGGARGFPSGCRLRWSAPSRPESPAAHRPVGDQDHQTD